ncbi:MAG: pantetheine-phosphate adenylyltransferase [Oscillospiraceae bacterium]|nr:pantetheine-phosphate adenylyltransferase [Oscillospiraceae bacterium]
MSGKAIYPGSFDPFTNGHLDIVRKSAALFDKVFVVIGVNASKKRTHDCGRMKAAIENVLRDEGLGNCEVCVYEGLIAEFTKNNDIGYMVRGLRNSMDYNYEENIAEVNKLIDPHLEYVYFRAENVAVSSSMVRELMAYDRDVSRYVPRAVLEAIAES